MSPIPTDKIALFIDGANLYATAKTLGFDIDYKRLLKEFQSRGTLLRAFYCGFRRSRPCIPIRSRPGIPIGSRPPVASFAWVNFMMSSRAGKVKRPVDLEPVASAS
ncbi:hypothetical protein ACVWZV_006037 [Bradyrhizobium sp. GM5.1]